MTVRHFVRNPPRPLLSTLSDKPYLGTIHLGTLEVDDEEEDFPAEGEEWDDSPLLHEFIDRVLAPYNPERANAIRAAEQERRRELDNRIAMWLDVN